MNKLRERHTTKPTVAEGIIKRSKKMVGSFIIFLISLVIHIVLVSLTPTYDFLALYTTYTFWIVIVTAVLFVLFAVVKLFRK